MKAAWAAVAAITVIAGAAPVPAVAGGTEATATYIVVLKDGAAGDLGRRAGLVATRHGARVEQLYRSGLRGFALRTTEAEAQSIAREQPDVAFVEKDAIVSTDDTITPLPAAEARARASTQLTPWGVTRVGACIRGSCNMPAWVAKPRVWVLDTGIAPHPDLTIDWSRAFSSVGEGGVDHRGHGTHVAGTIAAKNNDFGVVGVAPGATLVPVQVISKDNTGSIAGIIAGIDHVVAQRLRCARSIGCEPQKWVVNMSLTLPASRALDSAVLSASMLGIRFAIAAGNDARPAIRFSPGHVSAPGVFTVSASCGPPSPRCPHGKDSLTTFSNYGNPPVVVAAPGDLLLSTIPGGGYGVGFGTSMASPHVAGLLARLPFLSTPEVKRHFCGRLTWDRDAAPDRIAFLYEPRSFDCSFIRWITPVPPPSVP